jgi:hypothetical protein
MEKVILPSVPVVPARVVSLMATVEGMPSRSVNHDHGEVVSRYAALTETFESGRPKSSMQWNRTLCGG